MLYPKLYLCCSVPAHTRLDDNSLMQQVKGQGESLFRNIGNIILDSGVTNGTLIQSYVHNPPFSCLNAL
jgi:hypothetical protein